MSEFKFACPICGQHITAASTASGTQLECPTCFQKIIVPQAPATTDSKFILSASTVSKPRPLPVGGDTGLLQRPRKAGVWATILLILAMALVAAAGVFFIARMKERLVSTPSPPQPVAKTNAPAQTLATSDHPVPTNTAWTMTLAEAVIPEETVAGRVNGAGFACERATLQGGLLSLRQGKTWPPELAIAIQFPAHTGEELSGKTVELGPDRPPPVPKVTLRWQDQKGQSKTKTFKSGYLLKLFFGQAADHRMPGKIYIALPDGPLSFAAGTFNAEIRPAQAPKQPSKPPVPVPNPPSNQPPTTN